jgi:hypothetical protein
MNGGENMSRNRFARSFAVSLVAAVLVVLAIPLTHCSTSMTPGTDTGMAASSLAAGNNSTCVPNTNPNNPVICIATGGVANPDTITMNKQDNGVGNPIIWRSAGGGGTLTLNLSCPQIETPTCHGSICIARTNPSSQGTCTYTATLDGVTGTDPIIVTDNCCPAPGPKPKK